MRMLGGGAGTPGAGAGGPWGPPGEARAAGLVVLARRSPASGQPAGLDLVPGSELAGGLTRALAVQPSWRARTASLPSTSTEP